MKAAAGAPEKTLREKAQEHKDRLEYNRHNGPFAPVEVQSEEEREEWYIGSLEQCDWFLALIDADRKLRAERDKRLADRLGLVKKRLWDMNGPDFYFDTEMGQIIATLSNTQTEPEESKSA